MPKHYRNFLNVFSLVGIAITLIVFFQNCSPSSMQSAQTSANAPSSTDESALSGCDCGSTDAGKPCKSQFVEYIAGTSKIRFDFQCSGGDCKCGKFANQHDYWVAPVSANGTVHLTRMSPAVIGTPGEGNYRNGWVVNPDDQTKVGLDGRFLRRGILNFRKIHRQRNLTLSKPPRVFSHFGKQTIIQTQRLVTIAQRLHQTGTRGCAFCKQRC